MTGFTVDTTPLTVEPLTSVAHAVAVLETAQARQGLLDALDSFLTDFTNKETTS